MKTNVRWIILAAAIVAVAFAAFRLGQRRAGDPAGAGGTDTAARADVAAGEDARPAKAPRGWATHADPLGFTVQSPKGWTVAADPATGRIDIRGDGDEAVVIWPVFIPGTVEGPSAGAILARFCAKLDPAAAWSAPEPGANVVRARGESGARVAVAAFTWVASPKGSAGFLYMTAAPQRGYRDREETFARILASFAIAGAPSEGEGRASGPDFVRWQDPRENAFSLEVPGGWRVGGGLFRFASVDTRPAVEIVSPDGDVRVTGGDPEIPPFTVPNPTLQMTGFVEGSWYSPGYGVNMMVRRYMTGLDFARDYVASKVARGASALRFVDARDRRDVAEAINSIYGRYGGYVSMRMSTGEVAFTCTMDGRPMSGYCFAGTLLTEVPGSGALWHVEMLHGYLAAEEKVALAQQVLDRGLQTFQFHPEWSRMQQNVTAQTSRIVSETHAHVTQVISDNYWSRQGVMDEISRRRSNVTLGVEDVVDPVYGKEYQVESGSNYYWIDHRGTIVGTDTYTTPGIDFREMVMRP